MADDRTVEVKVKSNAKIYKEAMEEAVEKILEECGQVAEGYAKRLCPVDTGLLRNSITHAISGKAPAISSYEDNPKEQHGTYSGTAPTDAEHKQVVYIGTNVEYGEAVETGGGGRRAQPYLKPAVTEHSSEYEQIARQILKGR